MEKRVSQGALPPSPFGRSSCHDPILPWPCFGPLSLSQESRTVPSRSVSSRSHLPSEGLRRGGTAAQQSGHPSRDALGWWCAGQDQLLAGAGLPQPCTDPASQMVQERTVLSSVPGKDLGLLKT